MSIKTKAEDVKIVKSAFLLASFSVKKNHKTEEGKHNKRRVFLKHLSVELWDEDACRSDSRVGGKRDSGRRFNSPLLLLMSWELLWDWCCCPGLFLCASVPPSSFHLLRTLAAKST